jgi:hypothetical protein
MAHELTETTADRFFAGRLFNETWTYLDKPSRSPEETEAMIHCAHASFHHWTRAPECTPANRAIGYWQLSRVHAVAGRPADAEAYARQCLAVAETVEDQPWIRGSAHEALARSAALRGDRAGREEHVAAARAVIATLSDPEEKKIVQADVDSVPEV